MTSTASQPGTSSNRAAKRGFMSGLIYRQIDYFPNTGQRYLYLTLTVIATATLYYEIYVMSAVSTLQLADLHMSFLYYATLVALSNLAGAFGSVTLGIVDRYGRANFLIGGLVVTGVLTFWAIPACSSKLPFAILTCIVGFVEGICLVATPALIRDYSPQIGRATAMGFWTMGPVLGSLIVSLVGSATLNKAQPDPVNGLDLFYKATRWQHEYYICGTVGIIVAVACFVFLRELSPRLRDQVMVSLHDRVLIEAKAQGLDLDEATKNPWRQMLKPDIVVSAVAISVFLLIYYTLIGASVLYYQTAFPANRDGSTRFPIDKANDLGNWQWLFLVAALVLIGAISDRLKVRKPIMVVGGVGAAIFMVVFLQQAGEAVSFTKLAVIVACLSFCLGLAYTPWMASFTETVEARNPALTANGLAVYGWIVRVIITATFLILPHILSTTGPLVDQGARVQNTVARYSNPAAFPAELSVGGTKVPLYTPSASGTGLFGWAQNPANAPLLQFATQNKQTLTRFAQHVNEINALKALPVSMQANPSTITSAALAAAATTAAQTSQANYAVESAAAGAAKAAGLPVPVAQPQTAQQIAAAITDPTTGPQITSLATTLGNLASDPKTAPMVSQAQADALQLAAITVASAQPDFVNLQANAPSVVKAQHDTVGQWRTWYWICFACIIFFLLTVPLLKGHWSPRRARKEFDLHEAMVDAEMTKLHLHADA
jgi:MFS family permease